MKRPEGFDSSPADDPIVRISHDDVAVQPAAIEEERAAETDDTDVSRQSAALHRGQSYAKRTDRLMRAAERRVAAEARAAAKATQRAASEAAREAKKAERGEVRRFTAARRRVRLYWLGGLVAAVVVFFGLVGLVYSPAMSVDDIQISGTQRVSNDEIVQALEPLMGQPIATVTDEAVRSRLQSFTALQSYVVDIVPPGTIIVRVVERQPVAIVAVDGSPHMFDPVGIDLGTPDGTYPTVTGVEPGSDVFAAVTASLVAIPAELSARVVSVTATTTADVTMQLDDGSTVVWGSAEDSALKADVLDALVAATTSETPVTYDVRAPEHPVVR